MTDWTKVMEVFGSGIIGVYLIMGLLMVLMQISFKLIDYFENWIKKPVPDKTPS